jgi:hypothetical protein
VQKLIGFLIFSLALINHNSHIAHANSLQSQKIQLQCKEKAKELAQSSYTSCLNDARQAELDKVKSDYKEKLDKLKNYYDKKIKSLSPNESDSKTATASSNQEFPKVPIDRKNTTELLENTDKE